ncbi:bifunctional hydroxymethylpyrimidine kinase/phosphomethylpyrimidine kinase [Anaeromyxobacter terrae]|uniref:bifunctional hydroxymethylpyrimidine kinase/phosphomethylpyrimidine kinase n=1 Tax=Anaeromyxobacter terrae TaxID=2925406 RepID=UPI001F594EC8|nr:hydroxymethylpyrimidine/phosphomethylpyrimidine kinase [Anaeromyxobacter sp. SG22]
MRARAAAARAARAPRPARGSPPRVLVVAGLDPSGGGGLLADVEAIRAVGAEGWAVATALTAQGPGGARGFEPASPGILLAQIDALVLGAERPRAVKTGMLAGATLARTLAIRLGERPLEKVPLVVDPVLAASSGASLFDAEGQQPGEALAPLLARARLVTPNLPELAALTGLDVSTDDAAVRAARALPARAVLVKGGHRAGAPLDLLVTRGGVTRIAGRRRGGTARGTGCRLASTIAALLARGASLEEAVRAGKRAVERYLDRAAR